MALSLDLDIRVLPVFGALHTDLHLRLVRVQRVQNLFIRLFSIMVLACLLGTLTI